jgi:hypothetical protein
MSRTIAFALFAGALSSIAAAAPQNQLIAPNLNPALRTVPSVPHTYYAGQVGDECDARLATRVDSGTVITGPNGRVAHLTGMADSAVSSAQLIITTISADGLSASADLLACVSPSWATPAPVAASLPVTGDLQSLAVRTQTNSIVLRTR